MTAQATATPERDRCLGLRFDPRQGRGHLESYFVKANDPRGERALWLRWTIYASDRSPDRALAEVWGIAFGAKGGHVAVKSTVPFAEGQFARDGLAIEVDGCALAPLARAEGSITTGAG